ncbi:hypothetical protein KGF57_000669, partial [Candida theae]
MQSSLNPVGHGSQPPHKVHEDCPEQSAGAQRIRQLPTRSTKIYFTLPTEIV